jgi:large subunit ribosomal protein L1
MRKLSRRHKENTEKTKNKIYSNLDESIQVLKETATTKFVESVELHANLNIDPKYADQQLRTTVTLPHGVGKQLTIAVLTNDENFSEAENAGADIVGNNELIENITKGNIDFDLLIATPNMMPKLAKLGRVLGPKGLMPSPKSGTVSSTLEATLTEFKKGKFEYKADKTGVVHVSFGKSDFTELQLVENLQALYNSIEKNRPSGVKGKYFKNLFICTTMGPSIKLETFGVDASAAAGGTMVMSAAGPAEEVEEKTEFDVSLDEVPADKKIAILKVVRSITGLGLKEAKELVESAPKVIQVAIAKNAAEEAKKQIEDAGGKVSLK